MMTQTEWNELYTQLYKVYEMAVFKDEYVRSTIGDALDHMCYMKEIMDKVSYPQSSPV